MKTPVLRPAPFITKSETEQIELCKPTHRSVIIGILTGLAFFTALYIISGSVAYSLLFTFLLFVHELGHAVALWAFRLGVSRIIFIPFIGAATFPQHLFRSEKERFYVYFAGPAAGLAVTIPLVFLIPADTHWAEWVAAFGLLYVNLVNLITSAGLDGWHMLTACIMSTLKQVYGARVPYEIAEKRIVKFSMANALLILTLLLLWSYAVVRDISAILPALYGLPIAVCIGVWNTRTALRLCYYPELEPKYVEKLRRKGKPVVSLMWLKPMSLDEAKRCLLLYYMLVVVGYGALVGFTYYAQLVYR